VPAEGHSITAEQVLGLFEGRLAAYKHPRRVIVLDTLPRTSVGKIERKALRAMAAVDRLQQSICGSQNAAAIT
jgi:acyl-CoA synthetase (AMP-forming)/AMP-acid ligase II